ncbi:MAG: D-aminoacyl-tRNA deacylase, partial [Clostridia bacterium]|nr:D-aminoacyl-tRNA deacylase [Clostridia bacterium]
MKAVIQRVSEAKVTVDGKVVGSCNKGYMILFGAAEGDTEKDLETLANKTVNLRIFTDENDKMNLSLL